MPIAVSISIGPKSIKINRALMRKSVRTVLKGEGIISADVSLAFVDDDTSAGLNKKYLNHAGPTDVITFPYSKPKARYLEGELIIGIEVAGRVAKDHGHDVQAELALYVIHGVLHLCGYDDKKKAAQKTMRLRQRNYLQILALPPISD